jgi:hypothetical protein
MRRRQNVIGTPEKNMEKEIKRVRRNRKEENKDEKNN